MSNDPRLSRVIQRSMYFTNQGYYRSSMRIGDVIFWTLLGVAFVGSVMVWG